MKDARSAIGAEMRMAERAGRAAPGTIAPARLRPGAERAPPRLLRAQLLRCRFEEAEALAPTLMAEVERRPRDWGVAPAADAARSTGLRRGGARWPSASISQTRRLPVAWRDGQRPPGPGRLRRRRSPLPRGDPCHRGCRADSPRPTAPSASATGISRAGSRLVRAAVPRGAPRADPVEMPRPSRSPRSTACC